MQNRIVVIENLFLLGFVVLWMLFVMCKVRYCGDNTVKMSNTILFWDKVLLGNNVQLPFKCQELPNCEK